MSNNVSFLFFLSFFTPNLTLSFVQTAEIIPTYLLFLLLSFQSSSRPPLSLPQLSTRTLQHPTFMPMYLSADLELSGSLPKNHTGDLAASASAPKCVL